MKCKVEKKEKHAFQPVRIEIVLETKDEFMSLWHRLNIHDSDVIAASRCYPTVYLPEGMSSFWVLWADLNVIAREEGWVK